MKKKENQMYKSIERFLIAAAATVGFGFANLFAGTIHQEYDGPWHWDELTRQTKSLDGKSALVDGVWYPILEGTEYTGTAEITGSKTESAHLSIPSRIVYWHCVTGPWGEKNVETLISYQTNDFEVVSITAGNVAPGFQLKSWLKDISIPSSVTNIGHGAFYGCANLTNVSLSARIDKIQEMTFCGTGLTSIKIPDSVKTIEFAAFCGCSNLCEIVTPNSVEIIGDQAFVACPSLTRVVLTGVTNICQGAFWKCYGLRTVSLSQNLKNIDRYAFALTSLESITIPDSVETIDDEAFFASGIKHLVVGKGVQSTGFIRSASGAGSLEFHSASVVNYIASSDIIFHSATNVVVGSEICEVPAGFYEHFPALKQSGGNGNNGEIDDPNATVVTVQDGLLVSVQGIGLTSLDIPKTVTQVADTAFSDCSELREIIIPDSVESIEANAFHNCTNLERLVVGSGVMEAGMPLFSWSDDEGLHYGSPSLKELVVASPQFYDAMFRDEYGYFTEAEYPAVTNVVFAGDAFETVGGMGIFPALETVTIPESVWRINDLAFQGCVSLKDVAIPDSVEYVGQDAFMGCDSLERIVVGSGVESVGSPLFGWWDVDAQQRRFGSRSLKELVVASPQFYDAMFRDEHGYFTEAEYPAVTNVVFGWRFEDVPENVEYVFPSLKASIVEAAFPQINLGTDSEIASALYDVMKDSRDIGLTNITEIATYNAFVNWAESVGGNGQGRSQTLAMVKKSPNAWLSFALGAETLIDKELSSGDVRIESFSPDVGSGQFAFEVSVNGVAIGSGSVAETVLKANLKKVLGIEGSTSLSSDAFSPDNIEITFDTPQNGKARLTATPPADVGNAFFMRVKVR